MRELVQKLFDANRDFTAAHHLKEAAQRKHDEMSKTYNAVSQEVGKAIFEQTSGPDGERYVLVDNMLVLARKNGHTRDGIDVMLLPVTKV